MFRAVEKGEVNSGVAKDGTPEAEFRGVTLDNVYKAAKGYI